MARLQSEQIEAYKCPKCDKVIIGSRKLAQAHLTMQGIELPIGLVLVDRYLAGDPGTTQEDFHVVVSAERLLDHEHNSRNTTYILGSGRYDCRSEGAGEVWIKNSQDKYGMRGHISHTNGILRDHLFAGLTQKEFADILEKLNSVNEEMVKEELEFLNGSETGIGYRWMIKPGYAYSRERQSWPAWRIDKIILREKFGLNPKDLTIKAPKGLESRLGLRKKISLKIHILILDKIYK
jgi:hypothetical protein